MENTEAVAAATNVHWIVLQNLLRKPETHAHLNMAATISQVRERTPIQTQGMVTLFRNWLNWWNVNAAENK